MAEGEGGEFEAGWRGNGVGAHKSYGWTLLGQRASPEAGSYGQKRAICGRAGLHQRYPALRFAIQPVRPDPIQGPMYSGIFTNPTRARKLSPGRTNPLLRSKGIVNAQYPTRVFNQTYGTNQSPNISNGLVIQDCGTKHPKAQSSN